MEKTSRRHNVAKYMRLSRDDGDDRESESISNQRQIIDGFIEYNLKNEQLNIIDEYIDDGFTRKQF